MITQRATAQIAATKIQRVWRLTHARTPTHDHPATFESFVFELNGNGTTIKPSNHQPRITATQPTSQTLQNEVVHTSHADSQGLQNEVVHAQPTLAPSSQQPKNEVVRTKTSSSPPMDNEATPNLQKTIKAFVFQTYPTTPKDWLHQPLTLQKQVVQQLQSPATNGAVDNPQHPNTL